MFHAFNDTVLIEKYRDTKAIFAMLCKNSVARKIFANMVTQNVYFESCEIFEFDAKKIFGISATSRAVKSEKFFVV